jgi:hypothetical protein
MGSTMSLADEQTLIGGQRKRRIFPLVATALVLAVCALPGLCWLVWGTPAGPFGSLIAYPFFTHPPASVDRPPLLPDAKNVDEAGSIEVGAKAVSYETTAPPNTVYQFYEEALVKDGWGGTGYFSKPQLTSGGMTFEWHQAGINGCETLGYTLQVIASETTSAATHVQLRLTEFNPCT